MGIGEKLGVQLAFGGGIAILPGDIFNLDLLGSIVLNHRSETTLKRGCIQLAVLGPSFQEE